MGTLEVRFNLHGNSLMQSALRILLCTPIVHGLQHAVLGGVLGLAFTGPVVAQTDWRPVQVARPITAPSETSIQPPDVTAASEPAAPQPKPQAVAEGWLQMFGVRLSTATRDEMRQAIRKQGLPVLREDDGISEDVYDAFNLMPGLQQLKFSYTREGQKLARVDYAFMTFSDNAHVEDVKIRIEGRFGRPLRVTGREESGPYHVIWRLPDQMEIFLGREWPQRTTYLKVFNVPVLGQAAADSEREALESRQARIQNNHALPIWVKN
ncbi:hypothetical protein B9Z47_03565 [Limnohabitans sp. 2KL-1]|jgi:hypothetical protein|nr:hypothetical protein B9Z47_03565 [Limnohabitans sp. 2KL-1]